MIEYRNAMSFLLVACLAVAVMMVPGTLINGGKSLHGDFSSDHEKSEEQGDTSDEVMSEATEPVNTPYIPEESHSSADLSRVTAEKEPGHVDTCTDALILEKSLQKTCSDMLQIQQDLSKIEEEVHKSWIRRRSLSKKKELEKGIEALRKVNTALTRNMGDTVVMCTKCWLNDQRPDSCSPLIGAKTCHAISDSRSHISAAIGVFEDVPYLRNKYKFGVDVIKALYTANQRLAGLHGQLDCHWCHAVQL